MDPLLWPEFLLLLLEQGDRSLEDHTRLFLLLANATSYPDDALCAFYDASLNTACRALSSEDGPREDFAAFVEWTLSRNGSPLTVSPEDDLARSTPDPEPSPPSPCGAEQQPEPTDDGEPFPTAINEPVQSRATEWKIAPEVEPNPSDQVREAVTVPITREQAVDSVSVEWSSAPCTVAEGELMIHLGLLDREGASDTSGTAGQGGGFRSSSARSSKVPSSARSSKMPALPPVPASSTAVAWQPPRSPSAPYLYGVSPACLPSSSVTGAGVSLTSASSLRGPDSTSARRPSGSTSAPSSLASTVTRRSISSTRLPRPSSSALVGHQPAIASGLLSSGCASSLHPTGSVGLLPPTSSTLVLSRSVSAADLRISASVARALGSTLVPRSSASPWLVGSPSPPRAPPPPLVGPLESAAIPPPWLLPPSAPPWAIIMAVAWVLLCASCSGSLLSLPWLLPPSSPPWSLSVGPLPRVRPPPEPASKVPTRPSPSDNTTVRGRTFQEGA